MRAFFTLLVLLSLLVGRAVKADEVAERGVNVVLLLDVSPASRLAEARIETLRIHLSDVTPSLVIEQAQKLSTTEQRIRLAVARGRALRAAAVLFVEDLAGAELRIYWVEQEHGQVWMRTLAIGSDGFEADSERAALIARGGLEELLEAGRLSSAPVVSLPVEKPAPPPAGPRPLAAPQPHRLALGAGYVGTSFAKESAWQSGLELSVGGRLWQALYVAGSYSFVPTISIDHGGGSARLLRRPLSLVLGYRAPRAVALRAELGLFADYVRRTTTGFASGQHPTPASTRYFAGGTAKLGLDLDLLGRARLYGLFGLQIPFNNFEYLATDSSKRDVAIHPRVVRPLVELGMIAEIW